MLSLCEALGSMPSTAKEKNKDNKEKMPMPKSACQC